MYIVHDFLTSTVTVINPLFLNTSGILWGGGGVGGEGGERGGGVMGFGYNE